MTEFLQLRNQELQNVNAEITSELLKLQTLLKEKKNVKISTVKKRQIEERIQQLKQQVSAVRNAVKFMGETQQNMIKSCVELLTQHQLADEKFTKTKVGRESLRQLHQKTKDQITRLERKVHELEAEKEDWKNEKQTIMERKKEKDNDASEQLFLLKNDKEEVERELEMAHDQIKRLKSENERLMDQLNNIDIFETKSRDSPPPVNIDFSNPKAALQQYQEFLRDYNTLKQEFDQLRQSVQEGESSANNDNAKTLENLQEMTKQFEEQIKSLHQSQRSTSAELSDLQMIHENTLEELQQYKELATNQNPNVAEILKKREGSEQLGKRITELHKENSTLLENLKKEKMKIQTLQESLDQKTVELYAQEKTSHETMEDHTSRLQHHISQKEHTFRELSEMLEQKDLQISKLSAENKFNANLKKDNLGLMEELEKVRNLLEKVQDENAHQKSEIQRRVITERNANDDLNILKTSLEAKEHEINTLKQKLDHLTSDLNQQKQKCNQHQLKIKDLEMELSHQEEHLSLLNAKLREIPILQKELQDLHEEKAILDDEVQLKELSIKSLNEENTVKFEREFNLLKDQQLKAIELKNKAIQQHVLKIDEQNQVIEQQEREIMEKETSIRELESQLDDLETELRSKESELASFIEQNKEKKGQIENLSETLSKLRDDFEERLQSSQREFEMSIREKVREISRLSSLSFDQAQQIEKLKLEIAEYEEQCTIKDEEFEKFIDTLTSERNHLVEIEKENAKLVHQLKTYEKKYNNRGNELKELQDQIDEKNNSLLEQIQERDEIIQKLKKSLNDRKLEYNKLLNEHKDEVEKLKERIKKLSQNITEKKGVIESLDSKLAQAKNQHKPKDEEMERLQKEVQNLRNKLSSSEDLLRKTQSDLELANDNLENAGMAREKEIERLNTSITISMKGLEEKDREIKLLESSVNNLEKATRQKEVMLQKEKQTTQTLILQLQDKNQEIKRLMEHLSVIQKNEENLSNDLKKHKELITFEQNSQIDIKNDNQNLREEVGKLNALIQSRNTTIEQLKKHLAEENNTTITINKRQHEEILALKRVANNQKFEIDKLRGEYETMEHKVKLKEESCRALQNNIDAKQKELQHARQAKENAEKKQKEFHLQITKNEEKMREYEVKQKQLAQRESHIAAQRKKIDSLLKGNNDLETKMALLNRNNETLKHNIALKDQEISQLEKSLSMMKKDYEKSIASVKSQEALVESMKNDRVSDHDKINEFTVENQVLKQEVNHLRNKNTELSKEIGELKKKNLTTLEKLHTQEHKLSEISALAKSKENEINRCNIEIKSMKQNIDSLNDTIKKQSAEILERETALSDLERFKGIEDVRLELRAKIEKKDDEIEKLILELNGLKRTYQTLCIERDNVLKEHTDLKKDFFKLRNRQETTAQEVMAQDNEIVSLQSQVKSLQEMNKRQLDHVAETEKRLKVVMREKETAQDEVQRQIHKVKKQKAIAEAQKSLVAEKQKQITDQKKEIKRKDQDYQKLMKEKSKADQEVSVMKGRMLNFDSELEVMKDQLADKDKVIEDMQQKVNDLRFQLEEMKAMEETISDLNAKLRFKEQQIDGLQQKATDGSNSYQNMKTRLDAVSMQLKKYKDIEKDLYQRYGKGKKDEGLEALIDELAISSERDARVINNLNDKIRSLERNLESGVDISNTELQSLKNELSELKEHNQYLENQLRDTEMSLSRDAKHDNVQRKLLLNETKHFADDISKLKASIKKSLERCKMLSTQNEEYQALKEQLQKSVAEWKQRFQQQEVQLQASGKDAKILHHVRDLVFSSNHEPGEIVQSLKKDLKTSVGGNRFSVRLPPSGTGSLFTPSTTGPLDDIESKATSHVSPESLHRPTERRSTGGSSMESGMTSSIRPRRTRKRRFSRNNQQIPNRRQSMSTNESQQPDSNY